MLALGTVGYLANQVGGHPQRSPTIEFHRIVQESLMQNSDRYGVINSFINDCDFIYFVGPKLVAKTIDPKCTFKDPKITNQVFLWGDSYAQMLSYGLIKSLPENWQLLQVASRGCQTSILGLEDSKYDYCKQSNYFAFEKIKELRPKVVVLSNNRDLNQENQDIFAAKLHEYGVERILFIGKPPLWKEDLPKLIHRKFYSYIPHKSGIGLNLGSIENDRKIANNIQISLKDRYINLTDYFCKGFECQIYIGDSLVNGITTLDTSHLTPIASEYVVREVIIPEIISSQ